MGMDIYDILRHEEQLAGLREIHSVERPKTTTLKIDVDVAMNEALLNAFIHTRLKMLEELGYTVVGHKCRKTKKGYHFWFEVLGELKDSETCSLQFLLGDDQVRCRFNFLRNDAGVFQHFNALFSKKLKRVEHGEV